jgi:hypothetical protein
MRGEELVDEVGRREIGEEFRGEAEGFVHRAVLGKGGVDGRVKPDQDEEDGRVKRDHDG